MRKKTSSRKKSSKSSFRGKIKGNAAKRKSGASFGHLVIPSGLSVFVPELNTKVVMDILPYKVTNKKHKDRDPRSETALVGDIWFKSPYKTHGNVGANKDKAVCPASFGKKCPICEYQNKLRKDGASEEEIKAVKTSNRNLYVVRVISIDGARVKSPSVQIFDFSDYLFQEMFESQLGDEPEFDIYPDLEEGCSLKVAFGEGTFAGHKYPEPTRFDFLPRKKAIPESVEDKIPELDKCLDLLSYADLKEKFYEESAEEDEDEDEDESPRRKKKTTSSKKKFVADDEDEEDEDYDNEDEDYDEDDEFYDEDEDEDDDDGDDGDDDDEDYDEDEDPDEDEDEDEEEEEEEPVRKKRSSKKRVAKKTPAKKGRGLKCEYGHKFGRDYDKFDDCDDCEISRKCKVARSK